MFVGEVLFGLLECLALFWLDRLGFLPKKVFTLHHQPTSDREKKKKKEKREKRFIY